MADLFRNAPEYTRIESKSGKVLVSIRENGVVLARNRTARDSTWKKIRPAGTDTDALILELADLGWNVRPWVLEQARAAIAAKAAAAPPSLF
jgi:hypothetical protein